ncbi:hypothetical protein LU699_05675 [Luteimonas fraxinea]|uniref:DUF805 domain-containing protein n=1 Tax=Luteimonas fraxinea TaxID=2901869 RepID=A0ABS8U9N1_9GAMM|nr:hypothetical protein [Luteimonas fraxinea]MCD9095600.1 hypothetical protein [Luteimonas fraxinea]MCD9124182.1 hypothetical protein [Luteimonas fraxinea]UHH11204.1 hypothetical protein LU699_05675 [Luteimonas fraxinea]
MLNPFVHLEKNLGRAALLFIAALLGTAALTLALNELGYGTNLAVLPVLATMPFVAWFMSKAACAQRKSPWLYGLGSLVPPVAIYLFLSLNDQDMAINLANRSGKSDA